MDLKKDRLIFNIVEAFDYLNVGSYTIWLFLNLMANYFSYFYHLKYLLSIFSFSNSMVVLIK